MIFWITYLRFKLLHQLEPKRHFKIALRLSSIPAKVSNFRNSSVSGKERARERKVVGHDFRKRKLLTQTHHIQNFASQSGLRPPHHGHDFRKRKLPLATAPSCAVSRSKHFAVHKRQRSSLFLTAPFSSGCILCGSLF